MYDIDFFKNTYDIKHRITSGCAASSEGEDIWRIFESERSPAPYVFNIETTSFCNMKCVMCQRTTDFQRVPEHMPMNTFKRIVEQIASHPENRFTEWKKFVNEKLRTDESPSENNFYFDVVSKCVTLHGFGEPLLDPMLPERVAILTERSIPSYFSCNPCNIEMDVMEALFDAKTDYIKFAIDSLDDAEAKKIRGPNADFTTSYAKVLETLELKRKKRSDTAIVITMLNMGGGLGQERSFLDLWRGKDVYAYVKSLDNKWLLEKERGEAPKVENDSHYNCQYCEYAWTSTTVLSDGTVVPCMQDINAKWNMGNVNETSLEMIWNSGKYKDFRRRQLEDRGSESFMCRSACDWNVVSDFYGDKQ